MNGVARLLLAWVATVLISVVPIFWLKAIWTTGGDSGRWAATGALILFTGILFAGFAGSKDIR